MKKLLIAIILTFTYSLSFSWAWLNYVTNHKGRAVWFKWGGDPSPGPFTMGIPGANLVNANDTIKINQGVRDIIISGQIAEHFTPIESYAKFEDAWEELYIDTDGKKYWTFKSYIYDRNAQTYNLQACYSFPRGFEYYGFDLIFDPSQTPIVVPQNVDAKAISGHIFKLYPDGKDNRGCNKYSIQWS